MSAGRAHPKLSKAQSFPLSAEDHGAAQYWRLAAHHNSAPHLPSAHITCNQWLIALTHPGAQITKTRTGPVQRMA